MAMSRKPRADGDKSKTMSTMISTPTKSRAYRRKRYLSDDDLVVAEILTITTTPTKRIRKQYLPDHDLIKEEIQTKVPTPSLLEYLPDDLIKKEILTKVPTDTLFLCAAVSRDWNYSIHTDKRFTHSHFLQSQRKPKYILSLLNVEIGVSGKSKYSSRVFRMANGNFHRFPSHLSHATKGELVGYCNGFPCTAQADRYVILNPSRGDHLCVIYPAILAERMSNAHIICHGFGFDSLANTYKLISIFCTSQKQLNVVVFSLGTKSWRNVTATSALTSDGHSIIRLRAGTSIDKSAIFCGSFSSTGSGSSECLVWKMITTTTNYNNSNVETEMLLSFNLHDEKFQFIKLPSKSMTDEKENQFLVDYPHLLEFKGYPCIARIEKKLGTESDSYHRHSHVQLGSSCCCCCKIHLYVLKDKAKWVKEESFDVHMKSPRKPLVEVPDPCCFCFERPLTRIFSFSNQILLYWFNGEHLQVYNLRSEELNIVYPQHDLERDIFKAKMKEPSGSTMDYQLHCQGENFLSLQEFVPQGVAGIDADAFRKLDSKTDYSAYVFVQKGSRVFYPFLS